MLRKIVSAVVALVVLGAHAGAMSLPPEVLEMENKARFLPVAQSMKSLYRETSEQWPASDELLTESAARQVAVSVIFSMCDPAYVGRKGMIPFLIAYADYYSESKKTIDTDSDESLFFEALRGCAACAGAYQSKPIDAHTTELGSRLIESSPHSPCAETITL